jgi:hypothetical protein
MVSRLEDPVAQTRREARYTAATYHLGDTLRWIEESSWFQRDETAARPGAL